VKYSPHPETKTSDLIRLYKSGRALREIAAEVGISFQAVHERLKAAGVRMRGRGQLKTRLRPSDVRHLYCEQHLSVQNVAKCLSVSSDRVRGELVRQGIEIRGTGRYRRYSAIAGLRVGESVEVVRSPGSNPRSSFADSARRSRIEITVNKLGGGHWRVTRTQ
jgi:hypothetical protein